MTELEFKQESKAWKTKTKKDRVFEFLRAKPDTNIIELYNEFKNLNKNTVKVYKSLFSREIYGLKYNNLLSKYNYLLTVARSFYYTIHMGKSVPTSPLNEKELQMVKQLEEILKNG